jgi:hypothetical protein
MFHGLKLLPYLTLNRPPWNKLIPGTVEGGRRGGGALSSVRDDPITGLNGSSFRAGL